MIYYQLKMIYLPGKNDLFAKQKWFILNHKTLGTIQLFWQAVLRINHLNGSHHSFSDARVLYVSATPSKMAVPPTTTPLPTAISSSPAKNTPAKLSRFLQYVEEHEGIKDAPMF